MREKIEISIKFRHEFLKTLHNRNVLKFFNFKAEKVLIIYQVETVATGSINLQVIVFLQIK